MKRKIMKVSLITGLIVLLSTMILFFMNFESLYLLCSTVCALFCINILFLYIRDNKSQRAIIELSSNSKYKRLISIASYFVIFLSILKIPTNYFFITGFIILIMIVLNVSLQNQLVISRKGVRKVYYWNENRENIKSYNLNMENGVLTFQLKEGKDKMVNIGKKDYDAVLQMLKSFAY